MVIVVSSSPPERLGLTSVCAGRGWPCVECDSVRSTKRTLLRVRPKVVIVRHQLGDGYSDDVLALLQAADFSPPVRVVVLATAGLEPLVEARQIALGADVVHRDPIRIDVVLAQVERLRMQNSAAAAPRSTGAAKTIEFAGGQIDLLKHTLSHRGRVVALTPREIDLVRVLVDADGEVATYEQLYSDILGRPYRGDTSNMRVLLGKLGSSLRLAKLDLRAVVDVIPKSGYRYRGSPTLRPADGEDSPSDPKKPPAVKPGAKGGKRPSVTWSPGRRAPRGRQASA